MSIKSHMPNDNNENETKNAAPPKAAITTNDDDDNNNNNSAPPPPPKSPLEGKFQAAATALAEADVVLLVTGAGWSADSGLPIYADIAQVKAYERRGLGYADVARPEMMVKDPSLFYGFWGQALHDYRNTVPHRGFAIVESWRRDKMKTKIASLIRERVKEKFQKCLQASLINNSSFLDTETMPNNNNNITTPFADLPINDMAGSFYCFTSNCDAHFYDFLPAVDIHDCHGNVELWQCSNRDCNSGIWRAPTYWNIAVDSDTMEAPPTVIMDAHPSTKTSSVDDDEEHNEYNSPRLGHSQGIGVRNNLLQFMPPGINDNNWDKIRSSSSNIIDETPNWPKCDCCNSLARPAIFMFGDFGWKYDHAQDARWNAWRESVVELCREVSQNLKVCIVEVGCGRNVTTCRTVSESLLEELIETGFGGDSCLVRINPDFPEADDERMASNIIGIPSRGLSAIEHIHEFYSTH
mmetsp:Transcript_21268/g.44927  ORF Transcript_21268/g.44927 Transcript_21268/m.44927 type:complete len:466 (-) Transcript_21268:82-1479(-)